MFTPEWLIPTRSKLTFDGERRGTESMKAYRIIWSTAAAVVLAAGTLMAILAVPATAMVVIAAGTAAGACVARNLLDEQQSAHTPGRRYVEIGLLGFAAGLAVTGLVGGIGAAGVLLIMLVGASSPPVVRLAGRRLPGLKGRPPAVPKGTEAPNRAPGTETVAPVIELPGVMATDTVAVRELSDAKLIHAWQLSYVVLQHSRRAPDLAAIADLRRRYLDELERRDPAGFDTWMQNGPRAASNPGRYVRSNAPDGETSP
jgi:hypothetical protein